MPGTKDKNTNKPSKEDRAVRWPHVDAKTIQSCYCQDATNAHKKKFQWPFCLFVCLRGVRGF